MAADEGDYERQMEKRRYDFKRALEEIRDIHGRGTELVSVYVPPDKQISDVAGYLRGELSQSQNIKSKRTQKAVSGAIESILARLKYFKTPPPNGVIFFIGEAPTSGDQTKQVQFVLEPPEPITSFLYRCDSEFYTEKLWSMLDEKESFGLIVIDRSEATVGLLKGKAIVVLKNVQSFVPSKHGRGGQSALRFERLIEIAAHEFFKKVAEIADDAFLNQSNLSGILIGGPGDTKKFFITEEYLNHELRKKVLDPVDTSYTDEYGLKELVENAKSILTDLSLNREKELMQRFFRELRKPDGGLSCYGEAEVRHALELGAVDMLLISEGLRLKRIKINCATCGEMEITAPDEDHVQCPHCKSTTPEILEVKDFIDAFYDEADQVGTKVELLSVDSEEGDILLRAFGGLAAVLRYGIGGM